MKYRDSGTFFPIWIFNQLIPFIETSVLEINPFQYGELIFDKGGRNIKLVKIAYSINVLGDLDKYMKKKKRKKVDHQTTPHTQINSSWITDLNISHDTMKVLEEIIGRKISGIPHTIFSPMHPLWLGI